MRATLVARETIGYIWPQVEQYILKAFDVPCDEPAESVIKDLETGDAHLWVAHDARGIKGAAIARRILLINGRQIYQVIACGGEEMPTWVSSGLKSIERFAKDNDCSAVRLSDRPGWKFLERSGYKEPFCILEKAL